MLTVLELVSLPDKIPFMKEIPEGISVHYNKSSSFVHKLCFIKNRRIFANIFSVNIFLDALDASYCTYQGGDQPYIGMQCSRYCFSLKSCS